MAILGTFKNIRGEGFERTAKAAMTEGLATMEGAPTPELERLYGLWSDGGAGMLLSGNIQVDRDHLEQPGNVIIDREPDEDMAAALASWARTATRGGNHFWAQISHAGRQTPKNVNPHPKAPSAVPLEIPGGRFGDPIEMSEFEIHDIVRRFGIAAAACKVAGFTGVQIHGAHGYLISQFLSPRANKRTDRYGGELRNRARVLLDVLKTIREAVGPDFPVAVKLNSADFLKGGFGFEDSLQVAHWLQEGGIDLIEISGGTYEQPSMFDLQGRSEDAGEVPRESTRRREAFFLDYAERLRREVTLPLAVTGGFRTRRAMRTALENGALDVIGMARPFVTEPDLPQRLLRGRCDGAVRYEDDLRLGKGRLGPNSRLFLVKAINAFAQLAWYYRQIIRLADNRPPRFDLAPLRALTAHQVDELRLAWQRRTVMRGRRPV